MVLARRPPARPDDLVFTAPRGGPIREHKLQRQLGHKDAVQTLHRCGHLYPDELDSLAERLEQVRERACAAARTAPMRPDGAPVAVQIGKAAGQ